MKKFNIGIIIFFASFFIFSCGDNDEVINEIISSSTTVSGTAQYYYTEEGTTTILPSVHTPVFLGPSLVDIDTSLLVPGELYFGDGWYATLTDENGNYQFEDVEPFENWQLHLLIATDSIEGEDLTPDGDINEQAYGSTIAVSVELDELDDGNNFEYYRHKQYFTTISGQVDIDDDRDGIADRVKADVRVSLYETNESGMFDTTSFPYRMYATNSEGYYRFENVKPGFYTLVFHGGGNSTEVGNETYLVLSAVDLTPDSDPIPTVQQTIPVYIEEGEHDDLNNFTIQFTPYNIGGYMLRDLDGDGIGDSGALNERVELYRRDSDGNASGFVSSVIIELDGFFSFKNLSTGKYLLFNSHSSLFDCVSSMDLTPESTEPIDYEGCLVIASDVPTADSEDADNLFIVEYNF